MRRFRNCMSAAVAAFREKWAVQRRAIVLLRNTGDRDACFLCNRCEERDTGEVETYLPSGHWVCLFCAGQMDGVLADIAACERKQQRETKSLMDCLPDADRIPF